MAVESKPLFHPEVIRRHLCSFVLPASVGESLPKLQLWADRINSGEAGKEPRFRNRDLHGESPCGSAAVAVAISKSRFLSRACGFHKISCAAFRILYQIKGDEVRVLAIRRPSQDLMELGSQHGCIAHGYSRQ